MEATIYPLNSCDESDPVSSSFVAAAPDGAARFRLADAELALTPQGALWWPHQQALIVADLHLGKAAALTRRGAGFLPPYDSAATLLRLKVVVDALAPRLVICLGDSFHDACAVDQLCSTDRQALEALQMGRNWLWITGNHDADAKALGGTRESELQLEGIALRHEARANEYGPEISGHFHPKARIRTPRGIRTGRAAVHDGRRLILPAFGSLAGGLNLLAPPIRVLFPSDIRALVLGRAQVHAVPAHALLLS